MEIISGRNRVCKDSQGGIKRIYLFPFVKYSRSQIQLNNNVLISFPSTEVFEFEVVGDLGVTQAMSENDGGKFFDISFEVLIDGHLEINKFLKKDFRAVILDRLGNYRLLGCFNGLTCNSVNKTTGSGKSDFNGFKLSFEGQEIKEAPFFYDLNVITNPDTTLLLSSSDLISSTSVLSSATYY